MIRGKARTFLAAIFVAQIVMFPAAATMQRPQILTVEEWRADLHQLTEAIRDTHPRPFAFVAETEFDAAARALEADLPTLRDHQIMLRMAGLAGMIADGHTRLALPRSRPDLAFSYSHSSDDPPSRHDLVFGQLPLLFAALEEGLYVKEAFAGQEALVGSKVLAFGPVEAGAALERTAEFVSAENEGARRLNAADRLALPEVLDAIGTAAEDCGYRLVLERPEGVRQTECLKPLPTYNHSSQAEVEQPAFATRRAANGNLVLFDLNRIAPGEEEFLPTAFRSAIAEAQASGARLVIDLRDNTGGDNTYWRPILTELAAHPSVNRFGRTFVLIGPKTFSAAQSLLNYLERFTRVLFVGEPSGSRPDHYGDSKKIRLDRSGLTLRVSTLHWSSGTANDVRTATQPHVPAVRLRADLLSRRDAALEAVLAFEMPEIGELIADQLRRGHAFNAANIGLADAFGSMPTERMQPSDFLAWGETLLREGDILSAAYMLQIGTLAYPADDVLQTRFEGLLKQL